MRLYQNFGRQNSKGEYRGNYRDEDYNRERGRSRSRERSFSRTISNNSRKSDRSISNSRSRSGSRSCTNRDRIRCYKCRDYDHFASDCPNSVTDKDSDQDDPSHSALKMLTHEPCRIRLI